MYRVEQCVCASATAEQVLVRRECHESVNTVAVLCANCNCEKQHSSHAAIWRVSDKIVPVDD